MNLAFVGMAAALGLSASGSAFGAGFAGQAAVGAWKKCYASGKPAPFIMIAFAGAPLTQTIYGFLLMNFIIGKIAARRSRRNAEKPRQKAQTYNNQYDQNSPNHFYPLLYFLSLFRHLDFFQLFAVLQRRGVVFGAEYFDEIAHGVKATVHGNVEHAQICGGEQLQRVA